VRLAHLLLDVIELLGQLLVGVLDVCYPVTLELDPGLVLLNLEAASMQLKVLVLELPLQIGLVPLYLLNMLLVKLDSLDLQILEADLSLPLRLREGISFILGH
jgi:hypothetical protein